MVNESKKNFDTSVTLSGLRLDNPVVPASGTFGYGNEYKDFYDINILGSFSFKGTTREARFGNPTPRIAECTAGMINAVGLQNPGIDAVIGEELPRLKTFFRKPVIANISGFSVEEYAYCCERIDKEEQVGLIEVNVSCPNVRHGGMSFGTSPEAAAEVTRAVKAVTTKPVYIKLSPNVTDIVAIARACEEAGADGICLINTMLGMRIDVKCRKPIIANVMGGFSGAAIFPVAVRMALSAEVFVTTADGTHGTKGFVTTAIAEKKPDFDYFYACGPLPMLRALSDATGDIPGELSFEERMGCGFGGCMGCSCQTKNGAKRICKEGPVLKKEEIIW